MLTLWMWLGCAKAPLDAGDATLPEAVVDVAAQAPAEVLEGATASLEPSLRARAIALTVLTTADLDRWGPRGLWDPSPWVQRAAIEALDTRDAHDLLTSFVGRADAAPTSRALAALALDPGAVSLSDAWRAAEAPWTRAPLALAAWHHGDDDALPALTAALATGQTLHSAVLRGSAAAAMVVARVGCAPAMPTTAELDAFLATHPGPTTG